MTTKAQALAAARKRWGKRAAIEENKNAATREEREAAFARSKEIVERRTTITTEQQACKWSIRDLMKQARFVVDVKGGNPSIDELEKVLTRAERWHELEDERLAIREEQQRLPMHSYRWTAGHIGSPIPHFVVEAQADTLDELMEKIEQKKRA